MSERPPGSVPPPLLETLARDTLDPGYQRAADRRASAAAPAPSAAAARGWLAAGSLLVGLLVAVALSTTRANSAGIDHFRGALLADVVLAQQRESAMAASVSALNDELRQAQASAGDSAGLNHLSALEAANALVAVSGPGLRITLDDPEAATGNGAVLDRDIQLLVNGLWESGAEAIAIGGARLRVTSAIRQAGGAILVDNQPVLWPMAVEAIGNPDSILQTFVSTPGFGRFSSFAQLYQVRFEIAQVDTLTLPAAPGVDARYLDTRAAEAAPTT